MKITEDRLTREVDTSGVWAYQGPNGRKSPVVWWTKRPRQLVFFKRLDTALNGDRTVWRNHGQRSADVQEAD